TQQVYLVIHYRSHYSIQRRVVNKQKRSCILTLIETKKLQRLNNIFKIACKINSISNCNQKKSKKLKQSSQKYQFQEYWITYQIQIQKTFHNNRNIKISFQINEYSNSRRSRHEQKKK
ncbi:hypothetical protein TTHERM_000694549, partial (macronuclear) [Tetrahymena thermophila SB210]